MNDQASKTPLTSLAKNAMIWAALRELGIARVAVVFSGESDDGDIDTIQPYPPEATMTIPGYANDRLDKAFGKHRLVVGAGEPDLRLYDAIKEAAQEITAEPYFPDWYSNTGGHGQVVWVVSPDGPRYDRIKTEVHKAVVAYDITNYVHDPLTMQDITGEDDEDNYRARAALGVV